MTSPSVEGDGQIKFLLKTLEEVGCIDKRALISLMTVDLEDYPKGYLTKEKLDAVYQRVVDIDFIERKYNQLGHLMNVLSKLDDLVSCDGTIYYETDAKNLFGENLENKKVIKEPYLQRVYNCELIDESKSTLGKSKAESMIVGIQSQTLVPVHIKPIIESSENEIFDINNGLLLSGETGALFEKGYMSIDTDGTILPSVLLSDDMHQLLSRARLNPQFMNEQRMDYLDFYRHLVFADR